MTRIKEIEDYFDKEIKYHRENLDWYKQKLENNPGPFPELLKDSLFCEEICSIMVSQFKKDIVAILQADKPAGGR